MSEEKVSWYVIRVTQRREKKVYEEILARNIEGIELYMPHTPHDAVHIEEGVPVPTHIDIPINSGFIFVRCTREKYREVLSHSIDIKGLTPYYDHFHEYESGRNDYLTIPDSQFNSFRRICDAKDDRKLIDQRDMPEYLSGKHVKVITGLFAGVEGTLLRWNGLRRVFVDLGQLGKFGTGFIRSCDFVVID